MSSKTLSKTICFLSILLSIVACSEKKVAGGILDETESISAQIQAPGGNPVANAQVTLRKIGLSLQDTLVLRTSADSQGHFSIPNVPHGNYSLELRTQDSLGLLTPIKICDSAKLSSDFYVQKMSLLKISWSSSYISAYDHLWIPQLGLLLPTQSDTLTNGILVPPGSIDIYPVSQNDLGAIPLRSILINPSQLVEIKEDTTVNSTYASQGSLLYSIQPNMAGFGKDAVIQFQFRSSGVYQISKGAKGENTAGESPCFSFGANSDSTATRAVMQFDIDPTVVTDSSKVVSATIYITPYLWALYENPADIPLYIHKLLRDWKQGTGNGTCSQYLPTTPNSSLINGVSATSSQFGESWNAIGIGLDDVDATIAQYGIYYIPARTTDRIGLNITLLAKQWVADPSSNYGILLRSAQEFLTPVADFPLFHSMESSSTPLRPTLEIQLRE